MTKQVTLKIIGLVQGVGYRYSALHQAQNLGLIGYVTNLDDGSVELVAEGSEGALKKLIQWCYNGVGPAAVKRIESTWSEASGKFQGFVIKF